MFTNMMAPDAFHAAIRQPGAWDKLGALSGTLNITRRHGHYVSADANGADRNVQLWAAEPQDKGRPVTIYNAGATNNLVVQPLDHAGSPGATLATLAPGEAGVFYVDSTTGAWSLWVVQTGLRR